MVNVDIGCFWFIFRCNSTQIAWEKAEYLQSLCDEQNLLFGVIYDMLQGRWLVNCVDTNQWLTERFRGGHRSYYAEVWRQQ